jgi:predicted Zn-dependent peptidase
MKKLREVAPEKKEMDHLRNYLLGSMLRALDGPLAKIERLRNLLDTNERPDYFLRLRQRILSIEPTEVQALANRYLKEESLTFLSAGPARDDLHRDESTILQEIEQN